MIRKLFIFLTIVLFGITISINFFSCKKKQPVKEQTIEEETDTETAEENEEVE